MVTVNIVYCKKAKLVHTQDPDADYHDGPDKCAHLNPNIAQSMVKHGIQLNNMIKYCKICFTVNIAY